MKHNWWKLIVVVVLLAAVAVVVGIKSNSPDTADSVSEPSATSTEAEKVGQTAVEQASPKAATPTEAAKPDSATPRELPADTTKKATSVKSSAPEPVDVSTKQPSSQKPKTNALAKPQQAKKQLPKLVELGATRCVPCRMMAPVLEELKNEYKGKLVVVFVDVWENPGEAEKYGIQVIPTQIFYDEDGKEFFRHEGFFPKEDILKTFRDNGVKL
ncbi:MAG: thioredoxin domain-containing protein [Desulfitobacteriaceae bacterium]|nr:thioredoxin domain-containing protein [Desulfitobacteriaceae bacterium]